MEYVKNKMLKNSNATKTNLVSAMSLKNHPRNTMKLCYTITPLAPHRSGSSGLTPERKNQELSKKFINFLMVDGKKNKAHKIFSAASAEFLRGIVIKSQKEERNDKSTLLFSSIRNVQPSLEGRKCRVAGTTKIVPAIVSHKRGCALAIRWIIESAEKRKKTSKTPFFRCLAQELLDAYHKQGGARQRRDQYHKTCQTSRGNLRYRWW